jgi:hypothetical protein
MTKETMYQNTSDASIATREQHIAWTPDEEWMEAEFVDVESYWEYLVNERLIIEVAKED